jgi:hypothetical protein|tara:strand:+ start:648 stop:1268 length:621 start_codon:yes stop_codon:yes gene_type:complete
MIEGKRFLDKCLSAKVELEPWPYQILNDTLSQDVFDKLKNQCKEKFNFETNELHHIFPKNYKEYNLDFYDETVDICRTLLQNYKKLCEIYPKYRTYPRIGINPHISITPPLPYKFHIHQEGLEKIWSSVTYITPEQNVGTKMYSAQTEDAFVKEAKWIPNSTFIFCGQQGETWHSYESDQTSNRITLNLFIQKTRKNKCFIEFADL